MSVTFKQFVKEAKALVKGINYSEPPPKAKFQEGNIVLVRGDHRWKSYQPRYTDPYQNKVGVVVGYKNVPGAYSKFAVEFPDGNVAMFHSHYVYGPFKDVNSAEKYTDPNILIPPSEIETKAKTSKLTDLQSRPEIEAYLKKFVPKLGYKWLSTPKQILNKNSTYILTVFAEMDMQNCTGESPYGEDHPIKDKYSVFRVNKISSKKLRASSCNAINTIIGQQHYQHANNVGYFIEVPRIYNRGPITSDNIFEISNYGIPNEVDVIDELGVIGYYRKYHEKIKMINEGSLNTDLGLIKTLFDVKGNTIIGNIQYENLNLQDPYFFKPYKIEGNFEAYLEKRETIKPNQHMPEAAFELHDFNFTPREVTGQLDIRSEYGVDFTSMEGITQKVNDLVLENLGLKTLEGGLPEIIPDRFTVSKLPITDFQGAPKQVGIFEFKELELTSLKGIPKADVYFPWRSDLNGKQVDQKNIDHELLKGEMSQNALKTFSDLMDEL